MENDIKSGYKNYQQSKENNQNKKKRNHNIIQSAI